VVINDVVFWEDGEGKGSKKRKTRQEKLPDKQAKTRERCGEM